MSLTLLANTQAIGLGQTARLSVIGGTAPYSFNVLQGGGSIDSSTGVFTGSLVPGQSIIQAIDSLGASGTLPILSDTPLELFCDIIRSEMGLSTDQVYIYNQKFDIPKDEKLYIAIGLSNLKPFGNTTLFNSDGTTTQSVNMLATLSVNIMSRSTDALYRKEEVIMALQSIYAQSQQEINSFYIAKLPLTFVSLSEEDGPAILYRFFLGINMQYFTTKVKAVPFYDTFEQPAVTTED